MGCTLKMTYVAVVLLWLACTAYAEGEHCHADFHCGPRETCNKYPKGEESNSDRDCRHGETCLDATGNGFLCWNWMCSGSKAGMANF